MLQVQKAILDNPYKNQIETDSPLLVRPPRLGTSGQQDVRKQEITRIQLIGIVGGSLILVVLIVYCCGRRTEWKLCLACKDYVEDIYRIARHPMMAIHGGRERTSETKLNRQRSNVTERSNRRTNALLSSYRQLSRNSSIVTLSAVDSRADSDASARKSLL